MREHELLARLRRRLPPDPPRVVIGAGDDAAVTVPGGATATSVDAIVDGIHFRREQASMRQIGGKALAAALSDLAAMGAEPGEAYLVLFVPPDLEEADLTAIQEGALDMVEAAGAALVGGDLVRSPVLALSVTVVGHAAQAEQLVGRAGARPGDIVVATGELGGATAGLALLEDPDLAPRAGLDETTARQLIARQLEPQPRLAAGRTLAAAGATAMIDISDGLGADAGHLAEAGGVRLSIDLTRAALAEGMVEVAAALGRDPLSMAAAGGEDYELLACLSPEAFVEARRRLESAGLELSELGRVEEGDGVVLRGAGGREIKPSGFDQLRSRG